MPVEDTIKSKKGSGERLADSVREPMETAFGADFSGVKVHAELSSLTHPTKQAN